MKLYDLGTVIMLIAALVIGAGALGDKIPSNRLVGSDVVRVNE